MKTFLKILVSGLLLFNGIGAVYGGWSLMMYHDGSDLKLSMDFLKHTPFNNYFIPGIVLFVANGLLSLVTFAALVFKFKNYSWLVMAQGFILLGWLVVQIASIQVIYYLQFVLGTVALLLILCGWILSKKKAIKRARYEMPQSNMRVVR